VLLEKLTGPQLVKTFLNFTAFTRDRRLSFSWVRRIQNMPPYHFLSMNFILSYHLLLGLPSSLFPSGLPTKTIYALLLSLGYKLWCYVVAVRNDYWLRHLAGPTAAVSSKYCIQTHGTSPIIFDSPSTRQVHFMELKEQCDKHRDISLQRSAWVCAWKIFAISKIVCIKVSDVNAVTVRHFQLFALRIVVLSVPENGLSATCKIGVDGSDRLFAWWHQV
jgi:hypothetical protein